MYKTKVQELCHRNKWAPPRYASVKEGPDHNPCFKSSVFLNGCSFHTALSSKSSKQSQNDAAKLALLHFTSTDSEENVTVQGSEIIEISRRLDNQSDTSSEKNDPLMPVAEPSAGGPIVKDTSQGPFIDSEVSARKNGDISNRQHRYKTQLQNYVQRKNLDSPLYCCRREGPFHAPCFRATVTIDGQSFESPNFFRNLKEAEHAAAKVALMNLSSEGFPEDDLGFYKNLLHGLSQREGLCIPVYKTTKSGAPHMPTFVSSVELEGELFYGKAGRSKKEAEMKAAKIAYTALVERGQIRSREFTSPDLQTDRTARSTLSQDLTVSVDSQDLKQNHQLPSFLATKYLEAGKEEVRDISLTETISGNAKDSDDSVISPKIPHMDTLIGHPDKVIPSPSITDANVSGLSISNSHAERSVNKSNSYLLCNRVRIYTCIPDTKFLKGVTVLPISDNRWVAVRLEFPNETREFIY